MNGRPIHHSAHRLVILVVLAAVCVALAAAVAPVVAAGPVFQTYFGDLHAHSMYSDGEGTPAGAFWSTRAAGLDYFVLTDHNMMLAPWQWAKVEAAADAAYEPGAFAAMAGYELGWWYDHINVFNPPYLVRQPDVPQDAKADAADFEDVVVGLNGAIGMFNHPTWSEGDDLDGFTHWTPERDAAIDLVEIYNHGDGEAEWYEPSYVLCLDMGWHVMPTAVGDTHYVDWDTQVMPYQHRTALLATGLTRKALYQAMRARRGYATLDPDLHVSYALNGKVMGSVLTPGTRYSAAVHVSDPDVTAAGDAVTKLELISDGGAVVAAKAVAGHSVSWTPTARSATARWFYLRVTTGDGVTAWTAPVWTGR